MEDGLKNRGHFISRLTEALRSFRGLVVSHDVSHRLNFQSFFSRFQSLIQSALSREFSLFQSVLGAALEVVGG
jgi:hypothetical protein